MLSTWIVGRAIARTIMTLIWYALADALVLACALPNSTPSTPLSFLKIAFIAGQFRTTFSPRRQSFFKLLSASTTTAIVCWNPWHRMLQSTDPLVSKTPPSAHELTVNAVRLRTSPCLAIRFHSDSRIRVSAEPVSKVALTPTPFSSTLAITSSISGSSGFFAFVSLVPLA